MVEYRVRAVGAPAPSRVLDEAERVPGGIDVEMLAAPIGAPWLKIGEAMDFVLAVSPRQAFGTHDMTLSAIGLQMHRARLEWATAQGGGTFTALEAGESREI